jgi:tetratricopeptide (TPR) repeat protein
MKKKQTFNYSFDIPQAPGAQSVEQLIGSAISHHQQGNLQQAEQIYRKILNQQPDHADALNLLGVIESQHGRNDIAEKLISKALVINPAIPEYHNNIGRVYEAQIKFLDAKDAYQAALSISPEFTDAMLNLAKLSIKLGNYEEAEDCYKKIIDLTPARIEAYLGLGRLYKNTAELKKLEALYNHAIKFNPDNDLLHHELGFHFQESGRLAEAEAAYRKALKINPDSAITYYHLADISKRKSLDNELSEQINTILAREGLVDDDAIKLHFTLGKMFNDAERYDEAFGHYLAGNVLKRKGITFDKREKDKLIDSIIEVFDREIIESHKISLTSSELPIFIIGMPRSGSTLVEQIIASHPEVKGAGELPFFEVKAKLIPKQFGIRNVYPYFVNQLNKELLMSVAWEYLGVLKNNSEANSQSVYYTDKYLFNFLFLGFIKILFPGAPIIHCRRNPVDNCLAVYFTLFNSDYHQYAYDLTEIGHSYRNYQKLMEHWRTQFSEPIFEVDYSLLVSNQEQESRKIIDYLKLDWDDKCLEFYKTERTVSTASSWQVRQPVYNSSLERWKHYENYLDPLKEILGP